MSTDNMKGGDANGKNEIYGPRDLLQEQVDDYCEINRTGPNTEISAAAFLNHLFPNNYEEKIMTVQDKHRKPDLYVQLAQPGRNGKEKITDVGGVWAGKDGYYTGDTIAGRLILQPREAREALQEMRKQNAEVSPIHSQTKEQEM